MYALTEQQFLNAKFLLHSGQKTESETAMTSKLLSNS